MSIRAFFVKTLARYFRTVRVPASLETIAAAPGKYVLITQSDSPVVEALLTSLLLRSGLKGMLPCAARYHDNSSCVRWVSLHNTEQLRALHAQRESLSYCTVNIFKLRGPLRHTAQHKPSLVSILGLLLARRLLIVEIGTPIPPPPQTLPFARLVREIKVDFYRNLKLVRGTPLQSVESQMQTILSGAEFESELRVLAQRADTSIHEMRLKARQAFLELAANPRRVMYDILGLAAKLLSSRLFSEVIIEGLDNLTAVAKDHTVVLVPMHRSHLDYILVTYKLYQANVNPPLVAAGMNLAFWPAGFLFRSVGGYFVKRNTRDRLHALVLKRYVTYLVKRGHMQEFFIEGGRSRSGKMLQPKLGLLSIILDAWLKGLKRDILFVPVSIAYENVIEDEDYAAENTGRSKKKETLLSLVRALDIFRRKYGEVIIAFGRPISTASFAAERFPKVLERAPKRSRSAEKGLVAAFGREMVHCIRDQVNPTLTGLIFSALMGARHYALGRAELVAKIRELSAIISVLREWNPRLGEPTPALKVFLAGRESVLKDILRSGSVRTAGCLGQEIYYIPGNRRFTADFYRNSVIHLFFPLSLSSICQLLDGCVDSRRLERFHPIFAYDFILSDAAEFTAWVLSLLEFLATKGLVDRKGDGYFIPTQSPGLMMPGLLLSSVQAYLWVYHNLLHNFARSTPVESGIQYLRAFSYPDFIQSLQEDFRAAAHLRIVDRTEASSNAALGAVLDSLSEREIISIQEHKGEQKHLLVLKDFTEEARLLASANTAALRFLESTAPGNSIVSPSLVC